MLVKEAGGEEKDMQEKGRKRRSFAARGPQHKKPLGELQWPSAVLTFRSNHSH